MSLQNHIGRGRILAEMRRQMLSIGHTELFCVDWCVRKAIPPLWDSFYGRVLCFFVCAPKRLSRHCSASQLKVSAAAPGFQQKKTRAGKEGEGSDQCPHLYAAHSLATAAVASARLLCIHLSQTSFRFSRSAKPNAAPLWLLLVHFRRLAQQGGPRASSTGGMGLLQK